MSPDQWVLLVILFMAVIMLLGVPLVVTFGIGSIFLMELTGTYSIEVLGQVPFGAIDQWALLAMPLFILAGDVTAAGGIAEELADLSDKFLGWVRGGLGHTTFIACGFLSGITGSNAGDTATIGRIMIPALKKDGYAYPYAAAVVAAGACVGIIIPPSIVFIVYGLVTSTSVAGLFLGGILPGALMVGSMCVANYIVSRKKKYGSSQGKRFSLKALVKAHWTARHGLGAPFIILGGIYGGIFTPTEAGAVAVLYCFIAGLFFTRQLKLGDMPKILVRSGVLSSVIASLIAFAVLFGEVMGMLRIPGRIANFLLGFSSSPDVTILLILLMLMIAGCVLETIAIIVVLMPVLLPVGMNLGFDPVHYGVWVVVALTIGFITPPVGVNLFVASGLTGISITTIARHAVPFVIAMLLAELVIIYVPFLSTWYKLFATY